MGVAHRRNGSTDFPFGNETFVLLQEQSSEGQGLLTSRGDIVTLTCHITAPACSAHIASRNTNACKCHWKYAMPLARKTGGDKRWGL